MTMTKQRKWAFALAGVGMAAGAAMLVPGLRTFAADHLDPPARTDPSVDTTPDRAADIADVYAWHTDTSVVIAMTFAGPNATTQPGTYDRDVLYRINVSNTAPGTDPNIQIRVRFGKDTGANQWGVRVTGIPGVKNGIEGPVETNLVKDGVTVRAGLVDDPFFFDLQGFKETRSTGTLSFDKNRNFFAGLNDTAIIMEIPKDRLAKGTQPLNIWATTARFGGLL